MDIRLYDPDLEVNDIVYISEIAHHLDAPHNDTVQLTNEDITITGLTFASILSRMTRLADMIDQKNTLYDRAEAINRDGSIYMQRLEGQINVLKNQLTSSISSWYTDRNGNIVFEATTGKSAMMLTGDGFMIANGKLEDGSWNWRTFGTGEGFTADAITTGHLSADRIEAHSITVDHLSNGFGSEIDLSENNSLTLAVKEKMFVTGTEPPSNPTEGMLWLDTSDPGAITVRVYQKNDDNTYSWVPTTLTPEDIANLKDQVSKIEVLEGRIASTVSATNMLASDIANHGTAIQTLSSEIEQTAENITNTFTSQIENTNAALSDFQTTVTSWQTFSADGLELGRSDSKFKTKLSNEKLSFIEDDNEVAYVQAHKMYITDAQVTDNLAIGNEKNGYFNWYVIPKRGENKGGMALKWINSSNGR